MGQGSGDIGSAEALALDPPTALSRRRSRCPHSSHGKVLHRHAEPISIGRRATHGPSGIVSLLAAGRAGEFVGWGGLRRA